MSYPRRNVSDPFEGELREVRGWDYRPKQKHELLQPKAGYLVVPKGQEWKDALRKKLDEYEERFRQPQGLRDHSSYHLRCLIIRKLLEDGEVELGQAFCLNFREEFGGCLPATASEDLAILTHYLSGRENHVSGGTGFLKKQ